MSHAASWDFISAASESVSRLGLRRSRPQISFSVLATVIRACRCLHGGRRSFVRVDACVFTKESLTAYFIISCGFPARSAGYCIKLAWHSPPSFLADKISCKKPCRRRYWFGAEVVVMRPARSSGFSHLSTFISLHLLPKWDMYQLALAPAYLNFDERDIIHHRAEFINDARRAISIEYRLLFIILD